MRCFKIAWIDIARTADSSRMISSSKRPCFAFQRRAPGDAALYPRRGREDSITHNADNRLKDYIEFGGKGRGRRSPTARSRRRFIRSCIWRPPGNAAKLPRGRRSESSRARTRADYQIDETWWPTTYFCIVLILRSAPTSSRIRCKKETTYPTATYGRTAWSGKRSCTVGCDW